MSYMKYYEILCNCQASLTKHKHPQPQLSQFSSSQLELSSYQALINNLRLNDEIVYEYTKLFQQQIYAMNSHFFVKLQKKKFDVGLKWLLQLKPSQKHLLYVPINIQNTHWVAIAVDFKQKVILFQDSMGPLQKDLVQIVLKFIFEFKTQLKDVFGEEITTFKGFSRNVTFLAKEDDYFANQKEIKQYNYKFQEIDFNTCVQKQTQTMAQIENEVEDEDQYYFAFAANTPRQTGCDDCGVYSLMFLKQFYKKETFYSCGEIQDAMRSLIADEIVQGVIE